MYCYLYNTQTGCLRLLRELTFNKKEWKIGQVWTCWERFTYPIFYPFAFSRVRIFVHQIEFLVVSQVGYYSSFIYSWSIIHSLEHKFFCLGAPRSQLKSYCLEESDQIGFSGLLGSQNVAKAVESEPDLSKFQIKIWKSVKVLPWKYWCQIEEHI